MSSSTAKKNDVESGEASPLLKGSQTSYDPESEPPPLEEMKENTLKERAVAGAAAVAFSTSIAAMVMESNPAVYVSGAVGTCVAPYAAMQQEKITQVEALKQTNERLESEVQQLQHENERLSNQVNELESSVLQYVSCCDAHCEKMHVIMTLTAYCVSACRILTTCILSCLYFHSLFIYYFYF